MPDRARAVAFQGVLEPFARAAEGFRFFFRNFVLKSFDELFAHACPSILPDAELVALRVVAEKEVGVGVRPLRRGNVDVAAELAGRHQFAGSAARVGGGAALDRNAFRDVLGI